MTGRIQANRSTVTNYTPPNGTRLVGELFVNFADRRLMGIDQLQAAQDLLGVRRHAATATYATGDIVWQGGQMWRAKAGIAPHAFNSVEWDQYVSLGISDGRYLPLGGGTLTGPLFIQAANQLFLQPPAGSDAFASLQRAAGKSAYLGASTGSTIRWQLILASGDAEVGANSGSDFAVNRFSDSGVYLGTPFSISRATGAANFNATVAVATPTAASHATTKSYVDTADAAKLNLSGGTMTGPLTLSGAPSAANQAATKAYVDGALTALAYLPLSGGTITGSLNVNNSLGATDAFVTNALHINPNNGWEWYFQRDGAGNHIQNHTPGWYEYWKGTDGSWHWVSPSFELMTLTGGGDFYAHASLNAPNVNASNQIVAASSITSTGGNIVASAGTMQAPYIHSTGNVEAAATLTGNDLYVGVGGVTTSGGGSFAGNVGVGGQVSAANYISLTNIVLANDGNFQIGNGGEGRVINWAANQWIGWNSSDMSQNIHINGTVYWAVRGDAMAGNPNGAVFGTTFVPISDRRLKDLLDDEVEGLHELLQLRPVKYTLPPDERVYTGFVADEVEQCLPAAVIQFEHDGTTTSGLDSGALLAVAVHAIQQLEARVATLEGEL